MRRQPRVRGACGAPDGGKPEAAAGRSHARPARDFFLRDDRSIRFVYSIGRAIRFLTVFNNIVQNIV
ncbi:MAG: hypothetical protein LBF83_06650 [Spirochaetaceae bacterium]|nr:hypothetical protein [Spirochaetaceae bacterium]